MVTGASVLTQRCLRMWWRPTAALTPTTANRGCEARKSTFNEAGLRGDVPDVLSTLLILLLPTAAVLVTGKASEDPLSWVNTYSFGVGGNE